MSTPAEPLLSRPYASRPTTAATARNAMKARVLTAIKGRLRTMPVEERERLAEDYLAAWNSQDPAAVAGFFADGATYDDRGTGRILSCRAQIETYVADVIAAFPDLRFEIVRSAHADGFTMSEW